MMQKPHLSGYKIDGKEIAMKYQQNGGMRDNAYKSQRESQAKKK